MYRSRTTELPYKRITWNGSLYLLSLALYFLQIFALVFCTAQKRCPNRLHVPLFLRLQSHSGVQHEMLDCVATDGLIYVKDSRPTASF